MSKNFNLYDNISINRSLVRLVGPKVALYWSQLTEVLKKVFIKRTFDEFGYFFLDRDYIEGQIYLNSKEQYQCDIVLKKLGVLDWAESDRDKIRIDSTRMTHLITEDSEELIQDLREKSKVKPEDNDELNNYLKTLSKERKEEKQREIKRLKEQNKLELENPKKKTDKIAGMIKSFQNRTTEKLMEQQTDATVIGLVNDWIESSVTRYGFITNAIIDKVYRQILDFADNQEQVINLLNIAVLTGYKDFSYIKSYYDNHRGTSTKTLGCVSTEAQPTATLDFDVKNIKKF